MTLEALQQTQLWREFEKQARKQKRKPVDVLAELLSEYLDIAEGVALTEEMRRDASKSGYKEADAVRLVRELRKEKRLRRVAS